MDKSMIDKMASEQHSQHPAKVAYIVSAFPALSETFVLYEMIAMEKLGVRIELYPLRRLREKECHPEAKRWIERAHYHPFLSLQMLAAHWRFIRRSPIRYFKLWSEVLRGTFGSLNFFLGALAIFPKAGFFAQQMLEQGVTHVHAHFANHPTVAALIIHRLTGIPFSFSARGTDIQVDRHMLKQKIDAAEFVVSVSLHNKQLMVAECGRRVERKIEVVHGGVDVDRLRPRPKFAAGLFRILCVARFEEVKGHAYLIAACERLRKRGVRFECRLIGSGPLASAIREQIRRARLEGQILILGERAYPDVITELSQADVVVLPTAPTSSGKREGIPNVLKEAMACELPVIATAAGGIPELVTCETGVLVPPRDPDALALALEHLSKDRILCQQLGQAARRRVVEKFNLNDSVARRALLFLSSGRARRQPRPAGNSKTLFVPDCTMFARDQRTSTGLPQ